MKIKKNQKPIEIDAHLKYRCVNNKCNYYHWLSLKETQTKNFRIVCDCCGTIFRPKLVDNIKIKYYKKPKKIVLEQNTEENSIKEEIVQQPQISERLLVLCSKTLIDYGFTKSEAYDLLKQSYIMFQTEQPLELIENTLKMIGNCDDISKTTN